MRQDEPDRGNDQPPASEEEDAQRPQEEGEEKDRWDLAKPEESM